MYTITIEYYQFSDENIVRMKKQIPLPHDLREAPHTCSYWTFEVAEDLRISEVLNRLGIETRQFEFHDFFDMDLQQRLSSFNKNEITLRVARKFTLATVCTIDPILQCMHHNKLNSDIFNSEANILFLNIGSNPWHDNTRYQEKPAFIDSLISKGYKVDIFNIDPGYMSYKEYLNEINSKAAHAHNYFTNRYKALLDDDILYSKELLSILQEKMRKNIKVIICDNTNFTPSKFTQALVRNNLNQFNQNFVVMSLYMEVTWGLMAALVFPAEIWNKNQLWKEFEEYGKALIPDGGRIHPPKKTDIQKLQQFGFHVYEKHSDIKVEDHIKLTNLPSLANQFTLFSAPCASDDTDTKKEVSSILQQLRSEVTNLVLDYANIIAKP